MLKRNFLWLVAGVLLFNVGLVLYTLVVSQLSEIEHPPAGQFVTVGGVRMHVLDTRTPEATGEPIVLIHGASTSLLDMRAALLPAFTKEQAIVLVDRPGHGYSHSDPDGWASPTRQATLIAGALRQIGIERAVWVGHSWAGSVVLAGLLNETESVSAGVLLAGASHPWKGDPLWHTQLAARPILGLPFSWQYVQPGGRLGLESAIESVFTPEAVPDNYIAETGVELSLRPDAFRNNALDRTRLSAFLQQQKARYPAIARPLLLLTAGKDSIVPAWNHSKRLMRQVETASHHDYPNAGHGLHHTRASDIASRVSELAASLPEGDLTLP